jgi:hypothetical protein
MDVSVSNLESAIELIDESEREVLAPNGKTLLLNVGAGVVHAVHVDSMQVDELIDPTEAVCGTARRRLTPTFWKWESDHPEHLKRCLVCLNAAPVQDATQ